MTFPSRLLALRISPLLASVVEAGDGQRWAVTREEEGVWFVAHADGRRRRGGLVEVVRFVEGREIEHGR